MEANKQENKKAERPAVNEEQLWEEMEQQGRINVYKWIKILQAIILMVLGILFIVMAISSGNGGDISLMLSISAGIVLAVYGVMNILSGYLLYRHPFNEDVLTGEMAIAFAIVFFIKRDVLNEILSYFVIAFFFCFSAMLIIFGIDNCIHRNSLKHGLRKGVFAFIGAFILACGAGAYTYFYLHNQSDVERYMLMIVGALLIFAGIASLANTLVKAHNTKVALKQQKLAMQQQQKADENTAKENKEVKVIDISDLRKESQKEEPESDKIVVEEAEDNSSDKKDDKEKTNSSDKEEITSYPTKEEEPKSTAVTVVDNTNSIPKRKRKRK